MDIGKPQVRRQDTEALLPFGLADDVQHAGRPFDQPARETGIGEDEAAAASGQVRPQQRAFGARRGLGRSPRTPSL
jgi:hypothetical protein